MLCVIQCLLCLVQVEVLRSTALGYQNDIRALSDRLFIQLFQERTSLAVCQSEQLRNEEVSLAGLVAYKAKVSVLCFACRNQV